MAKTTGDVIVERLLDWGVDTVFGMPGDGINGIFEALRKNRDRIRFVQCRHEESAAFAACGYAKFTGRLGVCVATSGPGAIHLLNGLYDAKMDHAPVLAITGHTFHDLIGTRYQQEIDILSLFKDVAAYNQMILGAEHAEPLVDLACRSALSPRSVSHLTCPSTSRTGPASDERASMRYVEGHTSDAWRPPIVVPQHETLKSAAALLKAGQEGRPARRPGGAGGDRRGRAASPSGWPRRSSRRCWARRSCPTTHPIRTGGIGLLGTRLPSRRWRSATPSSWSGRASRTSRGIPSRARPAPCSSTSTRRGSAALPDRDRPGRRRQGHAPGAPAAARGRATTAPSSRWTQGHEGVGGADARRDDPRGDPRQAAGRGPARQRAARPTTRSSRPTRGRSRPGRRGTSRCGAGGSSPARATWRRMANGLPVRDRRRRWPIPAVRSSRSSATAASRC